MGFINSCFEALLQLAALSSFQLGDLAQRPLPLSDGIIVHPEHASKGFRCEYPSYTGWENCNGPNSRDCWIRDRKVKQPLWSQFDIHTDYEDRTPQGVHREFWLNVTDKAISPDGYLKQHGKVFNSTYPGPLIEACWGDDITVHVTNYVQDNGTTIHWHGIRQLNSNEMDGVNGVTQCPIADGNTFTYKFKAVHHYSLQYPDGVAGPLLIHGPTSASYDEAWDPILINDWSHNSAFADFQHELDPAHTGGLPVMTSILIDGHGNYTCNKSDPLCVGGNSLFTRTLQKGKKYLIRIINASTESMFTFSIDNHLLQVVSTDLVPIHPFKNESIFLGIGQRYSVIVEANPSDPVKDGNYWMRTQVTTGCGTISPLGNSSLTGIIRYDAHSQELPTSSPHPGLTTNCSDPPVASLVPIVPWEVSQHPVNNVVKDTYEAALDLTLEHGFQRWDLTDTPLWLDFSEPTILDLQNTTFRADYAVIDENYKEGYVYLIITGNLTRFNTTKREVPAAHPIHLHGHDFAILGQSVNQYNETESPKSFNFHNPPRRDVAMLPANGYLAIAFRPDNPGVWLLHCHIGKLGPSLSDANASIRVMKLIIYGTAWHASSGLALQIMERQRDIEASVGSLTPTIETCEGWDKWVKTHKIDQDDSGV
ncbi:MAG: hypothetical protein M1819_006255 [Sarea resinae]|nr:MAG: hypothetical protein M1819_006255 [Sarea resinae]